MKDFDKVGRGVFRMRQDYPRRPAVQIAERCWLWPNGSIHSFPPVMGGAVIEGALAGAFPTKNPNAQVFGVDPSTSGAIQTAIDACVAGNGDIILVERGGHEVSQTVAFDCSGIRAIAVDDGLSPLGRGEYNGIYAASSFIDGPAATITAPCYIEGFGFVSRDTGATFYDGAAALIGGLATALPFGVHMKHCRFPKWNLDNRIGLAVEGSSDCVIEECYFEGVGADFDSAIYVQGATQNIEIIRNHFRDCTYGVLFGAFAGGGPHCIILENVCEDAKLLSASSAATGLVAGNYCEGATDTGSYNTTVDTLNGYGLVFSANHYAE